MNTFEILKSGFEEYSSSHPSPTPVGCEIDRTPLFVPSAEEIMKKEQEEWDNALRNSEHLWLSCPSCDPFAVSLRRLIIALTAL
jgi:hypothetical protein